MKQLYVADIRPGDSINEIFVLSEKAVSHKKDGQPFLTLTLSDKTGRIRAVVWDKVKQAIDALASGDFIKVSGGASEYRGAVQITVRSLEPVDPGRVDPRDFLPAVDKDVEQMFQRLVRLCSTVENEHLHRFLDSLWQDRDLVEGFKTAPAAKKMHHAYLGGLLEHTLSMAMLADKIASHYVGVDRDLLLAGAVIHDIGKIHELEYDHRIDYTDQGRLLSHIVIGVQMIEAKLGRLPGFPLDLADQLKHMIISHHGEKQFGSPELPKTLEAVLLHYIDAIDSRMNAIRQLMAADDPNSQWTGYHRLLERHFFKGHWKEVQG